ncbi:MAG: AAA family ATPase, partial [Candidatus Aenigmatarchaeota archaeon]
MGIFSDTESGVFANEEVLSTEHLPDALPHREGDIQQLAHNIKPAARGSRPQNTFVFGPPGIGKTAVVRYVFREFEEYSEAVRCVYVNCWDFRTSASLLTQVIIELGVFVQRRGWSRDEIMQKLVEALNKRAKALVVCLDEVDQLDPDALYDLLRINQYVRTPVGIVFVSNNPHVFAKAEPRIRSSLGVEEVEFKPYTLDEMKDILGRRAKDAFR